MSFIQNSLNSIYSFFKVESSNMSVQRAVAVLTGDEGVKGTVWFQQSAENSPTTIKGEITGLSKGLHGFHIHQYGDRTNGCTSAGPHFNPFNKKHGDLNGEVSHVGDLGNLTATGDATTTFELTSKNVQLNGVNSVIGRSLVIHAGEDDLGNIYNCYVELLGRGNDEESPKTGNAGARLACGVIGVAANS